MICPEEMKIYESCIEENSARLAQSGEIKPSAKLALGEGSKLRRKLVENQ